MNAKKRKKAALKRRQQQKRVEAKRADARQSVSTMIPRPRVTEYNEVTVVPSFSGGVEAGPPSGSPGSYDVVFVLGVPGVSSVAASVDFEGMLGAGDSLLEGSGLHMDLPSPDGPSRYSARVIPNSHGRLAQVRLTLTAGSFSLGEKEAFDAVMPVLSRLAFEADTPVEVTAVLLTEQATQVRRLGATLVGAVQPAPVFAGDLVPELRPLLAAYREGLNSNSPMYQALSYYKVMEGVAAYHTQRVRAAARNKTPVPADPLAGHIPDAPEQLAGMTEWARANFAPHLGKSFGEIREAVKGTIRDAIAHLTPGRDLRIADYSADIRACRDITPVLRYIAREMIRGELESLVDSSSSASAPPEA